MAAVEEIVRAWRDPAYLSALTEGQRTEIPVNPAGMIAAIDGELDFLLAPMKINALSAGPTIDTGCTGTFNCSNDSSCCLTHFSSNPNCCF